VCAIGSAALLAAAQPPRTWTFDDLGAGSVPSDFTLTALRQTTAGPWLGGHIGGQRALLHTGTDDSGWSIALAPGETGDDLKLTARVRLAGGSRAGGLVWHHQDARNFMAVVLDLEDGDLELFRVMDGNRIRLEDRDGLELDPEGWHTIKVVTDDGRTMVSIGGIRVLDRREGRYRGSRPNSSGGRIGLLSHGRADAAFDDLRLEIPRLSGR
jgi:hypothetical protein